MRVLLKQRYIDKVNGKTIVYDPGEIIDIPHGQLLIDRGKAYPAESAPKPAPKPAPLDEPPPGRRGRPKGK